MTHPLAKPQRAAAVVLLLLVTLACSDGTIGGPPTFAIRNFSTEKGDYSYISRGTLIALDDGLKDGSYVVTLQYREKGETVDRNWHESVVFMTDGLATIEVPKYVGREEQITTPAPEYEWRMLGYTKLLPAKLTVQ